MADALPGAPAPSPLAAAATNPTTTPNGRPPEPMALLRLLDGWMRNTGHDDDHPWQVAIGQTLAAYGAEQAGPLPAAVDGLLQGVAIRMAGVLDLLDASGGRPNSEAVRSMVAQAGWLADLGLQLCDTGPLKGGAAAWLADDLDQAGLAALGVKL